MARGTFGERLKRERELREVTLEEITLATRIGPRFLEALENEDWEKLPGGVFNRGFVRSVARYLGLDEESLLGEYDLAHGAQVQQQPEKIENRIPSPPKWLPLVFVLAALLLIAALVAGGMYAWRRYAAHRAAKQAAAAALASPASSPAPAVVAPPPATDPAARPLDLLVAMSAATHVRVFADGKLVLDAELPTGDNRHFSANDHFEVTAADSSAVLLELNGQAMPPLGAPGASGTMTLGRNDLRQAPSGNPQP